MIERLRERIEEFLIELSRESYLAYSGRSEKIDLERVYKKYDDLANLDIFKEIVLLRNRSVSDEKRRYSYLAHFIAMLIEGRRTVSLSDEIDEKKASARVIINGEEMSYYKAGVSIGVEDDRDKRRKLFNETNKVLSDINPLIRKFWNATHDFTKEIGFCDYIQLWKDLTYVDFDCLNNDMKLFVSQSDDLYRELLNDISKREIGLNIEEIEPYDTVYLMNMNSLRDLLPKDCLLKILDKWTEEWDFDNTARGNIKYDVEERDRKSPRAFCSSVIVPTEIYLVIFPKGGFSDYQSFLHELGHAVHYGYTDSTLPMEYRYLGDNAITEAFAFLFDHLLINPLWVKRYISGNESNNFVRFVLMRTIFMLRRYSAKIEYELIFHKNDDDERLNEMYKELLEKNTMIKQNKVTYLSDIDSDMYVSNYLRAWILEALISSYLVNEFDSDWFINPRARDFLLDLYSLGQKYNAFEMATKLGYSGLDISVLYKRLEDIYNSL